MSVEQKTKQTIHNTAKKIAKEVADNLKIQFDADALDVIAEITYKKLLLYGSDLDAFQKHAKRSTVTPDDVKLLVRRNESLTRILEVKLHSSTSFKSTETSGKRKRKATSSTS